MNRIVFLLLSLTLILAIAGPAMAQTPPEQAYPQTIPGPRPGEPSVGMQILDLALVRPLCLVGSAATTAVYLAISPVAYLMGVAEPAARVLVEGPWRFTALRYIGQFDHYRDEKPITGTWSLSPSGF